MKLTCIHCGKAFTITAHQLGGKGRCPHCHGEITLPNAVDSASDEAEEVEPQNRVHWWQNSLSALISIVVHIAIVLLLALLTYNSSGGEGLGEEVLIGTMPSDQLGDSEDDQLSAENEVSRESSLDESLELEPPVETPDETAPDALMVQAPSAGGDRSSQFDLGPVAIGSGAMSGGSWEGMLQSLRRNGLDIVLVFDSTGSMAGEISEVKGQVDRIGSTLLSLVPQARISIATYRDVGDEYVVRGTPLTNNLQELQGFLSTVVASGGGDYPEAVHEGLAWAIENNEFRPRARKVVLVFGDAPPHQDTLAHCLGLASDFRSQQGGIISTVTCRARRRIMAFEEIADVGGGESFLTSDERQIMTQLMVLVFGSRHREKVVEAFRLMER